MKVKRSRPSTVRLAMIISVALLFYLVAAPMVGVLVQSLTGDESGFTLESYAEFARSPELLTATRNSLLVSIATALGSVLIGGPLAFGVARTGMRGKGLVNASIIVSFASPPFLMAIAYVLVAGPNNGYANLLIRWVTGSDSVRGPLDIFSLGGFVFLALPAATALVYLTLLPTLGNMNPALEEAARVGGAGPLQTLRTVTLPMMRPGILAGGLLAFSTALAMYATPHILGLDVLTVAIRRSLLVTGDFAEASTIAMVTSMFSLIVLFLYRRSIRYSARFQTISGKAFRPAEIDLGPWRHALTAIGAIFAFFAAILPYTLLIYTSFVRVPANGLTLDNLTLGNYHALYTDPKAWNGLTNSLVLGLSSALIITIMGLVLAYLVTRTKTRGRAIIDYITILPLGIAGTAFAVGVVVIHLEIPLKQLGIYGSIWLLLIAYVGRYIPFGMRTAQTSIMQVNPELEEAARISGATQTGTLLRITVPLVRAGLTYAFILGFMQSFTEVSTSVMLRGPGREVASTALLAIWQGPSGLPRASALSVVMFLVTMTLVLLAQRLGGQSVIPKVKTGRAIPSGDTDPLGDATDRLDPNDGPSHDDEGRVEDSRLASSATASSRGPGTDPGPTRTSMEAMNR